MRKCLNHGLNGLKDDTDYSPSGTCEAKQSVQSINPWKSVIQTGYKQTAVGVIPEDWEVRQFGDFAASRRDRVDPRKSGAHEFCVELEHIGQASGRLVGSTSTGTDASLKTVFQADDVLFGKLRAYLRKYWLAERGGVCSTEIWALHANPRLATPSFVYQVVTSSLFIEAASYSYGTHMPRSDWNLVRSCEFPLPPLPEQRAIATALSDVDALIAKLDQLIAKKRDLKQATMQQLLTGQTRLPGFSGEWKVRRLDELADIRSGGTPSTSVLQFWNGNIPWCTPTDITALDRRKYLSNTSRMITSHGLKSSSAEMIPAHSIVMTSRATIGECAINTVPVSTNQGFKNFVPFETTDVGFLYYLLTTQKSGFIGLCGGSTFLEIGKAQLATYQVRLPATKVEQTAIATILSDMDAEIDALEARRAKTRALKQGMMQELLTGRIRLL